MEQTPKGAADLEHAPKGHSRLRGRPERIPSEHLIGFSKPRRKTKQAVGCLSRAQAANDLAACPIGAMELPGGWSSIRKGSMPRRYTSQVTGRTHRARKIQSDSK